jgi:hypothetical protein
LSTHGEQQGLREKKVKKRGQVRINQVKEEVVLAKICKQKECLWGSTSLSLKLKSQRLR